MYSELIIRPKALENQIIYPDIARKLVGEALDGITVSPLLFNRQADGKTIQGRYWHEDKNHITAKMGLPPVVTFDGGMGFIRIYMIGIAGRELMSESASVIASAIAKHVGGPYSFAMNEGMCTIEPRETPVLYSARKLVMTKEPAKSQRYFKIAPTEVSDDIRRVLLRGLISQARWLDENSNGACNLEYLIPHEDSLGFFIAEGESCPILINDKNYAAGYSKLAFSMQLELMGPWSAGNLRSRGYGQIRKLILSRNSHV